MTIKCFPLFKKINSWASNPNNAGKVRALQIGFIAMMALALVASLALLLYHFGVFNWMASTKISVAQALIFSSLTIISASLLGYGIFKFFSPDVSDIIEPNNKNELIESEIVLEDNNKVLFSHAPSQNPFIAFFVPNKAFINAHPERARVFRVIKTFLAILGLLGLALCVYLGVKHGLSGLEGQKMMQGLWNWANHTKLTILNSYWKVGLAPFSLTVIITAVSKLFAYRDYRTATFKHRELFVE